MREHSRCAGSQTVTAACPRVGRIAPLRGRSPRLRRFEPRAVVRSYPISSSPAVAQ